MKEKIYLESLGCPKNLVDSEVILGTLSSKGYVFTTLPEDAEIIIVNTCAFIKDATQEAFATIRRLSQQKTRGRCQYLIVAGCLPQRYGKQLLGKFRDVDLFIGTGEFPGIAELLEQQKLSPSSPSLHIKKPPFLLDHTTPRLLSTPSCTAYVKIAEGCSHRCSFCTIPSIRGPYRSRAPASIITEVKSLVEQGVKEIILIAQDVAYYGKDLDNKTSLAWLLKKLSRISHLLWIRLLYCHPRHLSQELITTIKEEEKICNYLDLPLQHISDRVLKRMGRGTRSEEIKNLITTLRTQIPHLFLRTTLMVGFPGETEEDFNLLMKFIKEVEFEHLGAFEYSRERGTRAYYYTPRIPTRIATERYHTLMSAQADISLKKNQKLIGSRQKVLVEGRDPEKGVLFGRTFFQAPDSDGVTYIIKGTATTAEMVEVKITDASNYDLYGEIQVQQKH